MRGRKEVAGGSAPTVELPGDKRRGEREKNVDIGERWRMRPRLVYSQRVSKENG